MPRKIQCKICSKIFFVPPSEKNRKYCSQRCYGIAQRKTSIETCSVNDCNNPVLSKGLCNRHYLRLCRYGNPLATAPPKPRKKYERHKPFKSTIITKTCLYCGKEYKTHNKDSKFCSLKCFGFYRRKPYIIKKGYKKILKPNHPRADKKGYAFEHIIIAEKKLNRSLKSPEECHHIDKNPLNNNPENILVCPNHYIHMQFHRGRKSVSKCETSEKLV